MGLMSECGGRAGLMCGALWEARPRMHTRTHAGGSAIEQDTMYLTSRGEQRTRKTTLEAVHERTCQAATGYVDRRR